MQPRYVRIVSLLTMTVASGAVLADPPASSAPPPTTPRGPSGVPHHSPRPANCPAHQPRQGATCTIEYLTCTYPYPTNAIPTHDCHCVAAGSGRTGYAWSCGPHMMQGGGPLMPPELPALAWL